MNSTNHDRDSRAEARGSLGEVGAKAGCLDAETLAAWFDGGLDAAAVAAAEAHVSNCDRCQALVATMIKTLPAEAATAPVGVRLWRWWLAPIAAATAAVVIWAVVPQRSFAPAAERTTMSQVPDPARPTALPEPAKPAASPAPPSPAVVAPQTARPMQAAEAPVARDNAEQRFSPVPGAPAASRRQQDLADAAKRPAESDRLAATADREARVDAVAPAPAPRPPAQPAAVPLATTAPPVAAPAVAAAPVAAAPPTAAAEAAPAREEKTANRAATAAGAPAPADVQLRMRAAIPIEIVSPDPARRWRVSAEFAITRSEDGGRSWRQVRSAQSDRMTAGSAPSPDVCWFVGRNGLVLLTTDGTRFARAAFPVQTDLTGVTAVNGRTATVVTADGRTFTTDDGGATWRQN